MVESEIRYSIGVDKFDNLPKQLVADDFSQFMDSVLANRSPRKGKAYFCSAFSYGPHDHVQEYPYPDHYRLATHAALSPTANASIASSQYLYSGMASMYWGSPLPLPLSRYP